MISGYAVGIAVFSLLGGFLFVRFSSKIIVVISVRFVSIFTIRAGYSVTCLELLIFIVLGGFEVGIF